MSDFVSVLLNKRDDICTAVSIIKQELYVMGYPTIEKFGESRDGDDYNKEYLIVQLLNILWTLLKQRKDYINEKRKFESNLLIQQQDLKKLEMKVVESKNLQKIMKADLENKMKEIELMKLGKQNTLKELTSFNAEVCYLRKLLKTRNEEYSNKIRKKEYEIIQLQKTIQKNIGVRRCDGRTTGIYQKKFQQGVVTTKENLASASDNDVSYLGDQESNQHAKQLKDLYKRSICKLENTTQTLVEENINLRNSLKLLTEHLFIFEKDLIRLLEMDEDVDNNGDDDDNERDGKVLIKKLEIRKNCDLEKIKSKLNNSATLPIHLFNIPGNSNIINIVEQYISGIIDNIKELLIAIVNI